MRGTFNRKNLRINESGITLIALVITIIVLIILAGVAINMLSGDNGILSQSARAKEETEQANIEEQLKLAIIAAMTNEESQIQDLQSALNNQFGEGKAIASPVEGGWSVSINGKEYMVYNNGEIAEVDDIEGAMTASTSNRIIKDANNKEFVLPANFVLATNDDGSVIEDEITKGIVIEDDDENQYVWIPIFEKTTERDWGVDYSGVTSENDWQGIETALKNYTATYNSSTRTDAWYGDEKNGVYGYYDGEEFIYYTNGNMTVEEYNTLYHKMLTSVYTNGGFYIGRYEMGIAVVDSTEKAQSVTRTGMNEYTASNATNTSTTVVENGAPSIKEMNKPLSQVNAVAYNFITQSQAQMLAESLNYSGATSSLMFGVQWDTVCVFIEYYDTNNTATTKAQWLTNNTYSKEWGNYQNSTFKMDRGFYIRFDSEDRKWNTMAEKTSTSEQWICTTGSSDQNSSLNIYDFGGNLLEWTLEWYNDGSIYPGVYRGGYFYSTMYASNRNHGDTYSSNTSRSGRVSLFM